MTRSKLAITLTCIAGAFATHTPVIALTLGNIASQSSLGQPLRVVIPITLHGAENFRPECVKLLSDTGAGEAPQVVTGKVSFEPGAPTSRLVVTTARPMNDPAVRLSVQAGCGDTTRRDYVLLLDPSSLDSTPTLDILAAEVPIAGAAAAATVHGNVIARRDTPATATVATPATRFVTAVPEPRANPAPAARATVASPSDASPVPALREMITLVASRTSGGFISTAAAQSLPLATASRVPQPTSAPALERFWPYAAMALCLAGLALCAVVLRGQRASRPPAWSTSAAHRFPKSSGENDASPNTFASFTDMMEPAQAIGRKLVEKRDARPSDGELDTLLHEEVIDEHTIRQEWAAAASEQAVDIGTDSILQAIAAAEREMRIGPPEPAQLIMDNSLDNELLRKRKQR